MAAPDRRIVITDDFGQRVQMSAEQFSVLVEQARQASRTAGGRVRPRPPRRFGLVRRLSGLCDLVSAGLVKGRAHGIVGDRVLACDRKQGNAIRYQVDGYPGHAI
jgi:hypothetical protein